MAWRPLTMYAMHVYDRRLTHHSLQDAVNAVLLCECVYKVHDKGPEGALIDLNQLASTFGTQLVSLQRVQQALPHVSHSYMLAQSDDALYVSFMGTKQLADFLTNVNLGQACIWDAVDGEVCCFKLFLRVVEAGCAADLAMDSLLEPAAAPNSTSRLSSKGSRCARGGAVHPGTTAWSTPCFLW